MLEAAIQTISRADHQASFSLLSMYPEADSKLNGYSTLEVLRADPIYLGLVINSFALLYRLLPALRGLLRKNPQVRAIAEADVFLDQGGITFVDGREVFLLYNIASMLPALLIGTPVIKCSQALGPFEGRLNNFFARLFLPRINKILARGTITRHHLEGIGLQNTELVADYAFCLEIEKAEADFAQATLNDLGFVKDELNIGVFPSEVMRKKLTSEDFTYEAFVAELIDRIIEEHGATVYLIPHSLRSTGKRHNNDIPVCRDIYQAVKKKERCRYVRSLSSAQQLRYVVGKLDAAVVARFHAMVSALSMGTPVFVTGWSHKYQEVLDLFGLSDCALAESDVSVASVMAGLARTLRDRERIRSLSAQRLQMVKRSSLRHLYFIALVTDDGK